MSAQERNDAIRRAEAELLVPILRRHLRPGGRILEIGCGTGTTTSFLRELGFVVGTDPFSRPTSQPGATFVRAPAERLPFADKSFDLVFSTSVLEHLEQPAVAFAELARVSRPGATQVHVVPTHVWKALAIASHYASLARAAAGRVARAAGLRRDHARARFAWREEAGGAATPRSLLERLVPVIHGTARTNREELARFRPAAWQALFAANGLEILERAPLLLYSPPEMPIVPPLRLPATRGLSACLAYVVRAERP